MLSTLMLFLQSAGSASAEETGAPKGPEGAPFDFTDPDAYLDKGTEILTTYGPGFLQALLIFVIGRWILGLVVGLIKKVLTGRGVEPTLVGFLANILHIAGLAMILIAAIGQMGVDTTSFAAVLGAAVFAIGFALQGSLANFAAGVMIIFFRPFKVGDFVEAGGTSGIVMEITVFSTIMRTGDNKKVIVPNASMTGGNIVNYSANDTRRVDLTFGIGYGDDIKKAKEVMQKVCDADERILKDPAVTIGLVELGADSVNFVCRPWCKTSDYWGVLFDLNESMKNAFDENDISIPYPQRDVHLHEVKGK